MFLTTLLKIDSFLCTKQNKQSKQSIRSIEGMIDEKKKWRFKEKKKTGTNESNTIMFDVNANAIVKHLHVSIMA